jgi:hypothetical protein
MRFEQGWINKSILTVTSQSIIVRTGETKSLLPPLCKREEFPLFGKEGLGEIFGRICLFNYGLLSKKVMFKKIK